MLGVHKHPTQSFNTFGLCFLNTHSSLPLRLCRVTRVRPVTTGSTSSQSSTGDQSHPNRFQADMVSLDPTMFPHLSAEHRSLLVSFASAFGEDAAMELLTQPVEHQLARLGTFGAFVAEQRHLAEQAAQSQVSAAASLTTDMLRSASESRDSLERAVNVMSQAASTLSSRTSASAARSTMRAVKIDAPKFDGSGSEKLIHWLLAVERCAKAQLIDNNEQMVSFAISHLRGNASEWAYSALLGNADAFGSWDEFRTKIKTQFQPPNNEVMLQGRFFAMRQGRLSLDQYVQEMRSLVAAITLEPLPETVKVPAFLNGLSGGPARQALYRHLPPTMEEAIRVALIEQQSFRASRPDWNPSRHQQHGHQQRSHQPSRHYGPTPMDLSSVDVTCYNCGKRGHFQSKCQAPCRSLRANQSRFAPQARGGAPRGARAPRGGNGQPQ